MFYFKIIIYRYGYCGVGLRILEMSGDMNCVSKCLRYGLCVY